MKHPELKFTIGEMTGMFFKDPATGNVFELAIARQLPAEEIARRESEAKAERKKERAESMQKIGDILSAIFGDIAGMHDGSNGEPECMFCGGHHEDAFTSATAKFTIHGPGEPEVTVLSYTDRDVMANDVRDQLRKLEARGIDLHEAEPEADDPDDNTRVVINRWVTGSPRKPQPVLDVEVTFSRSPSADKLN